MNVVLYTFREAIPELRRAPRALWASIGPSCVIALFLALIGSFRESVDGMIANGLCDLMFLDVAIRTHRFVLLGPSRTSRSVPASVYLRFFLASIVIGCVYVAIVWVSSLFFVNMENSGIAVAVVAVPLALYLSARLSLVLPNRAVGDKASYREVWEWSERAGWRLVGALYLPLVAFAVITIGLVTLVPFELMGAASTLINLPATVFGIVLLSVAYRDLVARSSYPIQRDDSSMDYRRAIDPRPAGARSAFCQFHQTQKGQPCRATPFAFGGGGGS